MILAVSDLADSRLLCWVVTQQLVPALLVQALPLALHTSVDQLALLAICYALLLMGRFAFCCCLVLHAQADNGFAWSCLGHCVATVLALVPAVSGYLAERFSGTAWFSNAAMGPAGPPWSCCWTCFAGLVLQFATAIFGRRARLSGAILI